MEKNLKNQLKVEELASVDLTDKGFVLSETGERVNVIAGMSRGLGRVTMNTRESIEEGIRDAVQRVYADILPGGINGYIIHTSRPVDPSDWRTDFKDREVETIFSAVKYEKVQK